MKIGELAKKTDTQVVTIRYYEKEGLMGAPKRSDGNYRIYGGDDVERLAFIRHCRKHGMSLAEIKALLSFRDQPDGGCGWVGDLIERHIEDVEAQIRSLTSLKATLEDLRTRCSGDGEGDRCGILEGLEEPDKCLCAGADAGEARA